MINNLRDIEGAIFDMDGTLLDSMQYWDDLDERFLRKRNIVCDEATKQLFREFSLRESAEYFSREFKVPGTVEEIMDMINREMEDSYNNYVTIKPGVVELLATLKERNIPMCIATSTDRYLVEAALNRLGLADYFGYIFTCTEVGKSKANPDIFLEAVSALGTTIEKTPVFEDSFYAMKTAREAGFPVVAVYDDSARNDNPEIKTYVDIYVDSPEELLPLL